MLSPHPVQWETVVYLFHDDEAEVAARSARADDSAGQQDMAIDSHALAHFLALTALKRWIMFIHQYMKVMCA